MDIKYDERFQKKGNSSEFNPRNYEQVKSSPSLQVLSHESVKDTVKFDKRVKLRVPKKMIFLESGQNLLQRHPEVIISHRKSKEVINIAWFGHTSLPLFKRKKDIKQTFFPSCRNWPIYVLHTVGKRTMSVGSLKTTFVNVCRHKCSVQWKVDIRVMHCRWCTAADDSLRQVMHRRFFIACPWNTH